MITKRPERLRGIDYFGFLRYFLTICTDGRRPTFADADIVQLGSSLILEMAKSNGFGVPAYCFMPDHLHALVEGETENADFKHFVRIFKQVSAFRFRQRHRSSLWQPGYYEHILRDAETTEMVVIYIWENPIRAGLARELGEYPFCGSDRYTVSDLFDVWHRRT